MSASMESSARRGKFIKALTGFAIVNVVLRILLVKFFWDFEYDGLFIYTSFSLVLWMCVVLLAFLNHERSAYIIGVIDLFILSYVATMATGLEGGFYLLLVAMIPLNFYNTSMKKNARLWGGILIVLAIISLIGLMWMGIFEAPYDYFESDICFVINLIAVSVMLGVIGYLFGLADSIEEKERLLSNQRMMMMANTDPLTGLINRRVMMTKIQQEKDKMEKGGKPFSLVMIDVDYFKQINDEFGHDGGDFVLINLTHMINLCLRKTDLVARWGGDEFLVLLPETVVQNGQMVAEKIKHRIANTPFIYREMDIPVTVTLGVSECDLFSGITNSIRKADQALLQGKQAGKDRVVLTQ